MTFKVTSIKFQLYKKLNSISKWIKIISSNLNRGPDMKMTMRIRLSHLKEKDNGILNIKLKEYKKFENIGP